jgi:hypothetical protein
MSVEVRMMPETVMNAAAVCDFQYLAPDCTNALGSIVQT